MRFRRDDGDPDDGKDDDDDGERENAHEGKLVP